MTDDLLWQHLKDLPYFRALLRAVEARFYADLTLGEPALDLGCGDGHFASLALAGRAPLATFASQAGPGRAILVRHEMLCVPTCL